MLVRSGELAALDTGDRLPLPLVYVLVPAPEPEEEENVIPPPSDAAGLRGLGDGE